MYCHLKIRKDIISFDEWISLLKKLKKKYKNTNEVLIYNWYEEKLYNISEIELNETIWTLIITSEIDNSDSLNKWTRTLRYKIKEQ